MQNLEIREFTQAIINFTNQSPLPIEVKRLALRSVMMQLDAAADSAVKAELLERDRKEQEEKEKEETADGTEQTVQQD